ncbi:hypothetical protein CIPAW_16G015700 [Carya illinoinensis]|uniref:Uncharacterized protein n=1 Tax=Carya illinoinensis TaxID=32201 RepID=A0A8T1N2T0_CARIL|nr:hypothetical protein CIPAW_16G015700 [Carya illinoinensis]
MTEIKALSASSIITFLLKTLYRGLPPGILKHRSHFKHLPNVAEEVINAALTQVLGTIQPIWVKNAHLNLRGHERFVGIPCVEAVVEHHTSQLFFEISKSACISFIILRIQRMATQKSYNPHVLFKIF